MKRRSIPSFLALLLVGCNATGVKAPSLPTAVASMPETNPVSIVWQGNKNTGIESYQADVEVYHQNGRIANHQEVISKYRLAVKTVNGRLLGRIDFDPQFDVNGRSRSLILNDQEVILFDPTKQEIEMRVPADEAGLVSFTGANIDLQFALGRLNLGQVMAQYRQLNYDISQNDQTLAVSLPISQADMDRSNLSSVSKQQLFYDTESEVLVGGMMEAIEADGTSLHVTYSPIYQEFEGELIKIGEVINMEREYAETPELLQGAGVATAEMYSGGEEISQAELERLMNSPDYFVMEETQLIGDLSKMTAKDTVITVFNSLEINSVQDSMFRIAGGM